MKVLLRSFLALLFCLLSSSIVYAGGKLALVIGNGAYANATELPNPPNDASDMASTLSGMGFEVLSAINANKVEMDAKIREFAEKADSADVTLFFYAGHGMQVNGVNYLIPIDAKLESATSLDFETINSDNVIRYMSTDNRVGLVFLDACRDNPLSRRFRAKSRSAAVGAGLATRTGAEPNLLITFSTAPGEVALDGTGRNSPFTAALLKYLPQDHKELRSVLTDVKAEVQHVTDHQQIPWSHDNLVTNLYLLNGPTETANTDQQPVKIDPPPPPPPPVDAAKLAWDAVKDSSSPAALEMVANKFPDTIYGELAKTRATELRQAAKKQVEPQVATVEPQPAEEPPAPHKQNTRGSLTWGVIIGSYGQNDISKARSRLKQARSNGLNAVLINTDEYGRLSPGLYAVVVAASSRGDALSQVPDVQQYYADAYAKQLQ